jgi:hypothetical protein
MRSSMHTEGVNPKIKLLYSVLPTPGHARPKLKPQEPLGRVILRG